MYINTHIPTHYDTRISTYIIICQDIMLCRIISYDWWWQENTPCIYLLYHFKLWWYIYTYMYIHTDIYIRIQRLILYPFIIVVVTQGKITRPTTRGVRRVWYRAGSVSEPVTIFWVSWRGQYPIDRPTSRTCPTNPLMNTSTEWH